MGVRALENMLVIYKVKAQPRGMDAVESLNHIDAADEKALLDGLKTQWTSLEHQCGFRLDLPIHENQELVSFQQLQEEQRRGRWTDLVCLIASSQKRLEKDMKLLKNNRLPFV